jgi:aspartyl-tRNA(Asn)/glutamyl-tRNA(Gln) amidotransferase subunit A
MKNMTILELHNALLSGEITPRELLDQTIAAAKADNNNAFEYIMEKEAYEALEALDSKDKNNILWGIPFVIKDNFSTKDVPTTASSDILNGYCPIYNATVYEKLLNQGGIPIGKTTLDELALGGTGMSGHLGYTYNPWDKSHSRLVGGSSAGSASTVAAGIVPLGIGSDTGDSVRKPASFAGLVGFKPTWGRISRYGLFPFATSLDHVAYFTRSVEDAAVTLSLIAGKDIHDSTCSERPVEDYLGNLNGDLSNKRIAVIKEIFDSLSEKNVKDRFLQHLEELKKVGATIEFVSMDINLCKAILPTYVVISCSEATSNDANLDGIKFGPRAKGDTYEEVVMKNRTENFSALIKRRFIIGGYSLLKENQDVLFKRAQKCRRLIVDKVNEILKSYDAIYLPAAPDIAPTFDKNVSDKLSDEYLIADNHMAIGNFGGFPSLTLPFTIKDGMPIGANLTGKIFDEQNILDIAYGIEKATGYKNLLPKEEK